MKSEVDERRAFLHAIREKKDSRTILREALSNAYDAGATRADVEIEQAGSRAVTLRIVDNGRGLSRADFRRFFGLGLSLKGRHGRKRERPIGEKGLGTKLYFASERITVETRNAEGEEWCARMEDPLRRLRVGELPVYELHRAPAAIPTPTGARVEIARLRVPNASELLDLEDVARYLQWFSVAGSFQPLVHSGAVDFRVRLRTRDAAGGIQTRLLDGHPLPTLPADGEALDPRRYAYRFPPFRFHLRDGSGRESSLVEVVGAIAGAEAHVVQDRRLKKRHKGFFLAKDWFAVRSANEEVARGTGKWQSFHVLANCQDLKLTSDRSDFVDTDGGTYQRLVDALRLFLRDAVAGRPFTYFGQTVEDPAANAGRGYAELHRLKAERKRAGAERKVFLSLARDARRAPTGLIEPMDAPGTLFALQHLMTTGALEDTLLRGRHLLGVLDGPPLVLILGSDPPARQRPRLFALAHDAAPRDVEAARRLALDGLVCWRREGVPRAGRFPILALEDRFHRKP